MANPRSVYRLTWKSLCTRTVTHPTAPRVVMNAKASGTPAKLLVTVQKVTTRPWCRRTVDDGVGDRRPEQHPEEGRLQGEQDAGPEGAEVLGGQRPAEVVEPHAAVGEREGAGHHLGHRQQEEEAHEETEGEDPR